MSELRKLAVATEYLLKEVCKLGVSDRRLTKLQDDVGNIFGRLSCAAAEQGALSPAPQGHKPGKIIWVEDGIMPARQEQLDSTKKTDITTLEKTVIESAIKYGQCLTKGDKYFSDMARERLLTDLNVLMATRKLCVPEHKGSSVEYYRDQVINAIIRYAERGRYWGLIEFETRHLMDALSAPPDPEGSWEWVPSTCAVVPLEPTKEMAEAGKEPWTIYKVYLAMLAARPPVPKKGERV